MSVRNLHSFGCSFLRFADRNSCQNVIAISHVPFAINSQISVQKKLFLIFCLLLFSFGQIHITMEILLNVLLDFL